MPIAPSQMLSAPSKISLYRPNSQITFPGLGTNQVTKQATNVSSNEQTFPTKISGNQTCPDFISIARSKSPLPFESSGLRMHIWMASRSKVVGKPIGGEGVMMFHWHSHSFLIAPLLRSSLPTQETTDAIASNHNSAAFHPLSDCIEAAAEIHVVL